LRFDPNRLPLLPDFLNEFHVIVQFHVWVPAASVSNWMLGHIGADVIVKTSFTFGFVNFMLYPSLRYCARLWQFSLCIQDPLYFKTACCRNPGLPRRASHY
jgi:hypothetical protein